MSSKLSYDVIKQIVAGIDGLYEMEWTWKKGFGDWVYEYKYRRGGKTLCTLYAKQKVANILITLGNAEREKLVSDDIFRLLKIKRRPKRK